MTQEKYSELVEELQKKTTLILGHKFLQVDDVIITMIKVGISINDVEPMKKYQWFCKDKTNPANFKLTNTRYATREEAQEARQTDRWIVTEPLVVI
tara:strand:+ start:4951 stop:5238 length:288 start_codon:yes stop_codon:yes gene_type:complete